MEQAVRNQITMIFEAISRALIEKKTAMQMNHDP
jgi:hypothetical protein